MSNLKQRFSRRNPKVVRLSDPYDVSSSAPLEAIAGGATAATAGYEPLKVLGVIKEKGFPVDAQPPRVSAPQPRVTPFPVARHRSEGPYWAPISTGNLVGSQEVEDREDNEAGSVAVQAQPLWRKSKPGLQLGSERVHQELSWSKATLTEAEDGKRTPTEGVVEVVSKRLVQTEAINSSGEFESMSCSQLPENLQNTSTVSVSGKVNEAQIINASKFCRSLEDQAGLDPTDSYGTSSKKWTQKMSEVESIEDWIGAENVGHIQEMSEVEIADTQAELLKRLRPEVVDMLKRRGAAKDKTRREQYQQQNSKIIVDKDVVSDREPPLFGCLSQEPDTAVTLMDSPQDCLPKTDPIKIEDASSHKSSAQTSFEYGSSARKSWTERVEAVRLKKFDLDGAIVSSEELVQFSNGKSQIENNDIYLNVLERDFLRSEGDPASEGYSIKEATTLARSTVPGQRAAALRLISSILDKAQMGMLDDAQSSCVSAESGFEHENDWQAIWAYALGPEPQLVLTLRLTLDDSHATVLAACAKALQALLCCSSNQCYFHLLETFWPRENVLATAPVFRKRTKLEEGFIGGGRWKYNVKPSNLYPSQGKTSQEVVQEEGGSTVWDDTIVMNQDVAAGLIRTGILPRIRYIIEVEQLAVAEDPLLHVLIALARHSPQASESILQCPRLLEVIIQRFILTNVRGYLVSVRAIELLKTLVQASKATCIRLEKSGALQVALSDLFKQGLSAGLCVSEVSCTGLAGTCEALRLWRVCVKYRICISMFSDLYPALCFWLSAPSQRECLKSYENDDIFLLAQESYLLLGELAKTLPMLHAHDQISKDNYEAEHLLQSSWSWSMALPLIETSLGWLSPECTCILQELGSLSGGPFPGPKISERQVRSFVGALHAVLNFLSTVCGRVAAGKAHLGRSEVSLKNSNVYQSFWLPTFIPQVGLHLTAGSLLGFWKEVHSGMQSKRTLNSKSTLIDYVLTLREEADPETLLALVSCLHPLICLAHNIDVLLELAKPKDLNVLEMELSLPQVTLHCGILLAAENELQELLSFITDEISGNQLMQDSEWNGRGGPSPGVGLGWGSRHGGGWSIQILVAQKYALLAKDLLQYLPRSKKQLYKYRSVDSLPSPNIEEIARIKLKFIVGLGAMMLADPAKADMLEELLSDVLLGPELFRSIITCCHFVLKVWSKYRESEDSPNIEIVGTQLFESNIEHDRDILLQHFKFTWLQKRNKLKREDDGCLMSSGANTQYLDTIPEESSSLEDDSIIRKADFARGQMAEWAGSRLPLPNHWLLSPISSDVTQNKSHSIPMESLIRTGLLFLVGVEALMDQVQGNTHSNALHIPLVRKIHALSTLFAFEGDIFLQDGIRQLIGVLQDMFGFQLDEAFIRCSISEDTKRNSQLRPGYIKSRSQNLTSAELYNFVERGASVETTTHPYFVPKSVAGSQILNFELLIDANYVTFAEGLAETFAASSFGNVNFGCQVAIYLRREVSESIRVAIWKVLANAKALELLPSLKHCIGHSCGYLYPPEDSENVLEIYISAWTSGTLERAAGRNSLPFSLALHHVAAFLFSGVDNKDLLKKKYVRNLVRASARRDKQQIMLLRMLAYGSSSTQTSSHEPPSVAPSASQFQAVENRWLLFFEACKGDQSLLAEVQNLQKLSPQD